MHLKFSAKKGLGKLGHDKVMAWAYELFHDIIVCKCMI
jgi:hypothetical protein